MTLKNLLLISIFLILFSCQKADISPVCQLTKFSTFTIASNTTHTDQIVLKNGKIDKIIGYDFRHSRNDTINKTLIIYVYNPIGQVSQIRDESPGKRIAIFDFEHNEDGNPIKVTQKQEGVFIEELTLYFYKNQVETVRSSNLVGLNRDLYYDSNDNPKTLIRYDSSPFVQVEHEFDTQINFFAGIPEIKYMWIARPLFNFLPFGKNNIKSVRVFSQRGAFLTEESTLKSSREIEYNSHGFPLNIKRLNDNSNFALISESTFEYNCR